MEFEKWFLPRISPLEIPPQNGFCKGLNIQDIMVKLNPHFLTNDDLHDPKRRPEQRLTETSCFHTIAPIA